MFDIRLNNSLFGWSPVMYTTIEYWRVLHYSTGTSSGFLGVRNGQTATRNRQLATKKNEIKLKLHVNAIKIL